MNTALTNSAVMCSTQNEQWVNLKRIKANAKQASVDKGSLLPLFEDISRSLDTYMGSVDAFDPPWEVIAQLSVQQRCEEWVLDPEYLQSITVW